MMKEDAQYHVTDGKRVFVDTDEVLSQYSFSEYPSIKRWKATNVPAEEDEERELRLVLVSYSSPEWWQFAQSAEFYHVRRCTCRLFRTRKRRMAIRLLLLQSSISAKTRLRSARS